MFAECPGECSSMAFCDSRPLVMFIFISVDILNYD